MARRFIVLFLMLALVMAPGLVNAAAAGCAEEVSASCCCSVAVSCCEAPVAPENQKTPIADTAAPFSVKAPMLALAAVLPLPTSSKVRGLLHPLPEAPANGPPLRDLLCTRLI